MEPITTTALTAVAVFTTIVIAVVEAIKAGADRNWRTVALIVGAGVTGGLLGGLGVVPVIGVAEGVALGLTASGVVTLAKK